MIGDLEKEWRVSLLERNRNGVKLTSDGMKLLPYVKNVCGEYLKLQMQVDDLNGLQSGLIRIGTISSIATHWLPNVIAAFQKDYPNMDYELLLGHYADIEKWILEGRVDCGFLRLPTLACGLETEFLEKDRLLVVLPENHPLAPLEKFPVAALVNDPFILLEKSEKAEISELFDRCQIHPNIHFTTVDDYAVMSMVEKGLGISILPELILRRIPYRIVKKELDVPAYRHLGIAVRNQKTASLSVKRFMEYLDCRNGCIL
jgi:DNA-binding transcriptional LysR family regulator